MTRDSTLGANVGFGYLTDDDDDDATGGAVAAEFNAVVNSSLVSTSPISTAIAIQIDMLVSGGAQTLGSVRVSLSGVTLSSVTTTGLAGWTESGWTLSSGEWHNTLTRASLSVGTTSPTFSATPSAAGTLTATTNYGGTHAPHTNEATGLGSSDTVTITATSFDALADEGASTVVSGDTAVAYVDIIASGLPQSNGAFRVKITATNNDCMVGPPAEIDLAGWTNSSGWSSSGIAPIVWTADFTLASVIASGDVLQFDLQTGAAGTITIQTNISPLPATDQASGAGSSTSITVV